MGMVRDQREGGMVGVRIQADATRAGDTFLATGEDAINQAVLLGLFCGEVRHAIGIVGKGLPRFLPVFSARISSMLRLL